MARGYDPLDYRTWPEEQQRFSGEVWSGLLNGDLRPLAAYLRAGFYIDPSVGLEIADAIEGLNNSPFRIVIKGSQPGQKGWNDTWALHDRKMDIGVTAEFKLRDAARGQFEAVLLDVGRQFGIGRSAVVKGLAYARDYAERCPVGPGKEIWALLKPWHFVP